MSSNPAARSRQLGLLAGVAAYGLWGLFPIYFKALASVPPLEILAHRIAWGGVTLAALVWWRNLGGEVKAALRSRRTVGVLLLSTAALATNWLVYISAVTHGHVLEASLGYFVTPLVNVVLGVVVLRERLARPVVGALALAMVGVACMAVRAGHVPAISLALAFSWGAYGLLRKLVPVGALAGLAIETLILLPLALGYLAWQRSIGALAFHSGAWSRDVLLLASGPLTAGPLLLFGGALRRLELSTLAFLQYVSPTIQFLLAVFLYREPLSSTVALAFALIWTGLGIFAVHSIRAARSRGLPEERGEPELSAQEPA